MNLLIVDDDLTSLKLLRAQCEAEGHTVFEAHDGVDALALLERQRVDVVISDVLMPRMDGYRLCHEIRKHARLHDLPIILYTSTYTSPGDEKLALDVGADKYLKKPASVETIITALHEVIAMPHAASRPEALQEIEVLKEYSERLVSKLEEKNTELQAQTEALRESQAQLQLISDNVLDLVAQIRLDGTYVYVSPSYETLLGHPPQRLMGTSAFALVHLEDLERVQTAFAEAMQQGEGRVEFRYRHADGRYVWVDTLGKVFVDEAGAPAGFILSTRDITERRRTEEELKKRNTFIETILANAPISFAVNTISDGQFMFVGRNFEKIYGMPPDSLRSVDDFFEKVYLDPVFREKIRERVMADMATGEASRMRWENVPITTLAGEHRVVTATNIPLPEQNLMISTVQDVTERWQAEAAQRDAEARYRLLFEHSPDGIVIIDPATTRLLEFNEAAHRQLGYSREEFARLSISDFEATETPEQTRARIASVTQEGRSDFETRHRTRQGEIRDIQVTAQLTEILGHLVYHCVWRDITEHLQLEAQFRQAQKMESVGQLASGIAHDFNNLLTVINGWAEVVLMQVSHDDPVHAKVQEIHRAGERGATLTRQLLAFSRQQILESRVLNFNTVVVGMEGLLRRLLGEDIDLVIVPTPGVGNVKADPGQIEQVITNLAVNARDAMPQGGRLTIEVQSVTVDEDYARQLGVTSVTMPSGSYVLLVVSDSGAGMDAATCTRIFEPFFTTKGPGKGTGLGLSTVYGIVKQSHGFIWVYSEVGQGTSFKIYLPQVTEAAGTDRPGPAGVSSSGTETILLVEDNAALRQLATHLLAPAGYTVLGAATGEEALRLVERQEAPVHLLLTDVVMPGMSGRELAEQLAQARPGMKVLYMSGYTSDTIVRHGVLDAQVSFLDKPFTGAALLQKVREVLDS